MGGWFGFCAYLKLLTFCLNVKGAEACETRYALEASKATGPFSCPQANQGLHLQGSCKWGWSSKGILGIVSLNSIQINHPRTLGDRSHDSRRAPAAPRLQRAGRGGIQPWGLPDLLVSGALHAARQKFNEAAEVGFGACQPSLQLGFVGFPCLGFATSA